MASRYFTENSQRKLSTASRPETSGTEIPATKESTPSWPSPSGFSGPVGPRFNVLGFPEVKTHAAKRMADDGGKMSMPMTARKAKKMLKEGMAHGMPLTDKQKGLFGMIASGDKPMRSKKYKY